MNFIGGRGIGKIVINKCFGGFGLSPHAVARIAELHGHPCYFFTQDIHAGISSPYIPATADALEDNVFFSAFKVPNPNEVLSAKVPKGMEETKAWNEVYNGIAISTRDYERHDPALVKVVEDMGNEASGQCAELAIVEIPDDIAYEIAEHDGYEHVAEKHRTWYA